MTSVISDPFTLNVAATPAYMAGMSAYDSRQLTGSYAPSSGLETMLDVTPSEWLSGPTCAQDVAYVIWAWNGGGKGVGTKMFVHGGGHGGGCNNGMYVYDFNDDGSGLPVGYESPLVISSVSDIVANSASYLDGKPNAVHTYDGMVYAHTNNMVYRFGGSQYQNGSLQRTMWKYNPVTTVWTRLDDFAGTVPLPMLVYDPTTEKLYACDLQTNDPGYFFDINTDAWGSQASVNRNQSWDSTMTYDPTRNELLVVGRAGTGGPITAWLTDVDFVNETVTNSRVINPTGGTGVFGRDALSIWFDIARDVYWLWGGGKPHAAVTAIYEMDPDSYVVSQHNLSTPMNLNYVNYEGGFGRFIFMDAWRAIGLTLRHDEAPWVIKLP